MCKTKRQIFLNNLILITNTCTVYLAWPRKQWSNHQAPCSGSSGLSKSKYSPKKIVHVNSGSREAWNNAGIYVKKPWVKEPSWISNWRSGKTRRPPFWLRSLAWKRKMPARTRQLRKKTSAKHWKRTRLGPMLAGTTSPSLEKIFSWTLWRWCNTRVLWKRWFKPPTGLRRVWDSNSLPVLFDISKKTHLVSTQISSLKVSKCELDHLGSQSGEWVSANLVTGWLTQWGLVEPPFQQLLAVGGWFGLQGLE